MFGHVTIQYDSVDYTQYNCIKPHPIYKFTLRKCKKSLIKLFNVKHMNYQTYSNSKS